MAPFRSLLLAAVPSALAVRSVYHEAIEAVEETTATPLCDSAIVAETCQLLTGKVGATSATYQGLRDALSANKESADDLWQLLGLTGQTEVPCTDICSAAVRAAGQRTVVPAASDLACYRDDGLTRCDLDLRPQAVRRAVSATTKSDLPDFHDDEVTHQQASKVWSKLKQDLALEQVEGGHFRVTDSDDLLVQPLSKTIPYKAFELVVRTANLFRIYPVPHVALEEVNGTRTSLLEEHEEEHKMGPQCDTSVCSRWPNTCTQLPLTCGGCPACKCNSVCTRFPSDCTLLGSLCGGCSQCGGGGSAPSPAPAPVTPSRPSFSPSPSPTSSWKTEVQKRNLQALEYINNAVRKFRLKQTDTQLTKWFGTTATSDAHLQVEVGRVLNSVAQMLNNVDYVYPGDRCSPNTYAYVFPRGSWARNGDGKFVFYLCDYYMKVQESEQIETLTHEGSHHAAAYTDDVCMDEFYGGSSPRYLEVPRHQVKDVEIDDSLIVNRERTRVRLIKDTVVVVEVERAGDCENKAYGRRECEKLARKDAIKAIRNADNMCYYIQDITDA